MQNKTQMASAKTLRPSNIFPLLCAQQMPKGHRSHTDMPEETSTHHALTCLKSYCLAASPRQPGLRPSPPQHMGRSSPQTARRTEWVRLGSCRR